MHHLPPLNIEKPTHKDGNDLNRMENNEKHRRPIRAAATKARQRIANLNKVTPNRRQETPLHGWDFDRMMELWNYDCYETFDVPTTHVANLPYEGEDGNRIENHQRRDSSGSSDSIASSETSTFDASTTLSEDEMILPQVNPIPADLLRCQNLDIPLNLHEVIEAADNAVPRSSRRIRHVPTNDAEYGRTGRR